MLKTKSQAKQLLSDILMIGRRNILQLNEGCAQLNMNNFNGLELVFESFYDTNKDSTFKIFSNPYDDLSWAK